MMAEKKKLTEQEMSKKIVDLKIELLKNPTKRKSIKKEIARLLTMAGAENRKLKVENRRASDSDADTKSTEEIK